MVELSLTRKQREELTKSLYKVACGESTGFLEFDRDYYHLEAKELADELWCPPGSWKNTVVEVENEKLGSVIDACVTGPPCLDGTTKVASEAYEKPKLRRGQYYSGEIWEKARERALEKAGYRCERCGIQQDESRAKYDKGLNVHHQKPVREFSSQEEAHREDNLAALCPSCHRKEEAELNEA